MLGIAPIVFDTPLFAMKGGTALNLFLQNMPRLSVDIDVAAGRGRLAEGIFVLSARSAAAGR